MDCSHQKCWKIVGHNFTNCLACVLECLEKDDEPLTRRERVLDDLLCDLDCNSTKYISVLDRNIKVVKPVVDTILSFFCKLCNIDTTFQSLLAKALIKLHQSFSEDVVDAIHAVIEEMCMSCGSYRQYFYLLSLLVDLLQTMELLRDKLLLSSSNGFVAYLISGILYPDNDLREVLLNLSKCLVARCVETNHSLSVFDQLPSCLINMLFNSSSQKRYDPVLGFVKFFAVFHVDILIASLNVLALSAEDKYFIDWFTSNFLDTAEHSNNIEGIGKLFAGIKRVFHIHEDILSLHAIQAVNTMIKHSDLVQPLLDSDLVELIYDSLCASTDERIIKSAFDCVLLLATNEEYFSSCHAMYGIKPVCVSLIHLLQDQSIHLSCMGLEILKDLCDRQPSHISLLPSLSSFDQFLQVIADGISNQHIVIVSQALDTACSLLKHLPFPFPCKDLALLYQTMEKHLSKHLKDLVISTSSQCRNEEVLNFARRALSCVFKFIGECFRLTMDTNDSPCREILEFVEMLLISVLKQWVPLLKMQSWFFCSPSVLENCLICITIALEIKSPIGEELWEYFVTEGFIEQMLRMKSQFINDDEFRSFVDGVNAALFQLSQPLLHIFDYEDSQSLIKTGISNLRGTAEDMLHYLRESAYTSTRQLNQSVMATHCGVLTILALLKWHTNSTCDSCDIQNFLDYHSELHEDVERFPLILLRLKFFLHCVCQQESPHPDIPGKLMKRLAETETYILNHPAVLSTVLSCSDTLVCKEMKKEIICQWVAEIEQDEFPQHHGAKHLIGLTLLNKNVAITILDGLISPPDLSIFNKLVIVLTSAVESMFEDESTYFDENARESLQRILIQRLPEIMNLDLEHIKQTPTSVTITLLKLLHLLIRSNVLSNDVVLYRPRMLRKMIVLLNNGLNTSSTDQLNDAIVTSLLNNMELMLSQTSKSRSIVAELSLIYPNVEFLTNLYRLLMRPIENFCLPDVHPAVFKFLSTLIKLESTSTIKAEYCIRSSAENLLKVLEENSAPHFQSAVLLLWCSLFDQKFCSKLFQINSVLPTGERFLNSKDVALAPLTSNFLSRLFMSVLNCSAKGFSDTSTAALQCAYAMMKFAKFADLDFFFQLASSPWLEFRLASNHCENAVENELCLSIKSLTSI